MSVPGGYDMTAYYYPYWTYIQTQFNKTGDIPLWNDSIMCGTTIIGNAHFSYFYPPNWLFFILPVSLVFNLWFVIHFLIAATGVYFLCKYLKFSLSSTLFATLIFAFGGHFAVRISIGHYHLFSAVAWIPFVILFFLRLLEEQSIRNFLFFTLFLSLELLTLHLQIFYFLIITMFIYYVIHLIYAWRARKLTLKSTSSTTGLFALSGLLAVFICSAQLLPVIEATLNSHRGAHNYAIFSKLSLPFNQLGGFFLPDAWGYESKYIGAMTYHEITAFIGFSVLIPLIIGFTVKDRRIRSFSVISIILLIITIGKYLPFGKIIYYFPFMSFARIPARFLHIVTLLFALIAGAGLDKIISIVGEKKKSKFKVEYLYLSIFVICVILYTLLITFPGGLGKIFYPSYDNSEKFIETLLKPAVQYSLFISVFLAVLFFLLRRESKLRNVFPVFLIVLIFSELWLYNTRLINPVEEKELVSGFEQISKYLDYNNEIYRFQGSEFRHQAGYSLSGLQRATGYEALKNRYLMKLIQPTFEKTNKHNSVFDAYTLKLSQLLNSKYLIVYPPKRFHHHEFTETGKIYIQNRAYWVYTSENYLPRAYTSNSTVSGRSFKEFLKFFNDEKYKAHVFAGYELNSEKPVLKPVEIKKYSPNEIEIEVQADESTLLVINDTFFPGWHALVDNRETEIIRANYAFRGLKLDKGAHNITFRYFPGTLNVGIIISLFTMMGFAGFAVFYIFRVKPRKR